MPTSYRERLKLHTPKADHENRLRTIVYRWIPLLSVLAYCSGMNCQGMMPAGMQVPTLDSNIIRNFQPGDFVSFDERREGFENGQPFTLIGTVSSTMLSSTITDFVGNEVRISTITTNLVQQENQIPLTSMSQLYFSQDSDGTLYTHGALDDSGNPPLQRFVVVPSVGKVRTAPSPLLLGPVSSANAIEYTDGSTETVGSTAVAIEEVSVPAGRFAAIRVEGSSTFISGKRSRTIVSTSWFVPKLGVSVKVDSTVSMRDNSIVPFLTMTVTSELRETNISVGG